MKKGDIAWDYITAANYREIGTCIGFVIGFKYRCNTEILLAKNGDWAAMWPKNGSDDTKVASTIEQADQFIKEHQPNYTGILYARPYISCKSTYNN